MYGKVYLPLPVPHDIRFTSSVYSDAILVPQTSEAIFMGVDQYHLTRARCNKAITDQHVYIHIYLTSSFNLQRLCTISPSRFIVYMEKRREKVRENGTKECIAMVYLKQQFSQ